MSKKNKTKKKQTNHEKDPSKPQQNGDKNRNQMEEPEEYFLTPRNYGKYAKPLEDFKVWVDKRYLESGEWTAEQDMDDSEKAGSPVLDVSNIEKQNESDNCIEIELQHLKETPVSMSLDETSSRSYRSDRKRRKKRKKKMVDWSGGPDDLPYETDDELATYFERETEESKLSSEYDQSYSQDSEYDGFIGASVRPFASCPPNLKLCDECETKLRESRQEDRENSDKGSAEEQEANSNSEKVEQEIQTAIHIKPEEDIDSAEQLLNQSLKDKTQEEKQSDGAKSDVENGLASDDENKVIESVKKQPDIEFDHENRAYESVNNQQKEEECDHSDKKETEEEEKAEDGKQEKVEENELQKDNGDKKDEVNEDPKDGEEKDTKDDEKVEDEKENLQNQENEKKENESDEEGPALCSEPVESKESKKEKEEEEEIYEDEDYADLVREINKEDFNEEEYNQFLENNDMPTYTWDIVAHSPNVSVLESKPQTARRKVARQCTDGVRGCQGFTEGKHQFDFEFNDKPLGSHCSIGVCNKYALLHCKGYQHLLGRSLNSFGWDLPTRQLFFGGKLLKKYGENLEAIPSNLSMIVDLDQDTISFETNSETLGLAFEITDKTEPFYPAVTLVYGNAEVTITHKELPSSPSKEKTKATPSGQISRQSSIAWEENEENNEEKKNQMGSEVSFDPVETLEQEPEEKADIIKVETLDQYPYMLIQLAHAWDFSCRGGGIISYPNIPNISVPAINYGDKIQGIRCKTCFSKGQHRWKITEINSYTPKLEKLEDDDDFRNNMIIGVAAKEHRVFNIGTTLYTQSWPYLWAWEPKTKQLWHGQGQKPQYPKNNKSDMEIDLHRGIDLVLDVDSRKLFFEYEGECLGLAFHKLQGNEFYPVIYFKEKGLFPVEIKYISGPKDYVDQCVKTLEKMPKRDLGDISGHKTLQRQQSFRYDMFPLEDKHKYPWGYTTGNMELQKGDIKAILLNNKENEHGVFGLAVARVPLRNNRHVLQITYENTSNCHIGLVSNNYSPNEQCLGNDKYSWCWDLKYQRLYHAGTCLGVFPSICQPFKHTDFSAFNMIVDFGNSGYNTAAFSGIRKKDGSTHDFGVAFVNLPQSVYPGVVLVDENSNSEEDSNSEEEKSVTINYIAGPTPYVNGLDAEISKACIIL